MPAQPSKATTTHNWLNRPCGGRRCLQKKGLWGRQGQCAASPGQPSRGSAQNPSHSTHSCPPSPCASHAVIIGPTYPQSGERALLWGCTALRSSCRTGRRSGNERTPWCCEGEDLRVSRAFDMRPAAQPLTRPYMLKQPWHFTSMKKLLGLCGGMHKVDGHGHAGCMVVDHGCWLLRALCAWLHGLVLCLPEPSASACASASPAPRGGAGGQYPCGAPACPQITAAP